MKIPIHRPSFYIYYDTQSFIDSKSSSFEEVRSIRSRINSIASIEFMSDKYRRNIHIRLRVSFGNNKSSRRVLDAVMSTAGKMRLLDNFRSSCNSILPVPLNRTEKAFRLMQRIGIDTAGEHFTGGRRNRIISSRQTGDRV